VAQVKQAKGNATTINKTVRKKINDLGSVYDTKSMTVPGMNGSIVRTTAHDLKQMRGYGLSSATTY